MRAPERGFTGREGTHQWGQRGGRPLQGRSRGGRARRQVAWRLQKAASGSMRGQRRKGVPLTNNKRRSGGGG